MAAGGTKLEAPVPQHVTIFTHTKTSFHSGRELLAKPRKAERYKCDCRRAPRFSYNHLNDITFMGNTQLIMIWIALLGDNVPINRTLKRIIKRILSSYKSHGVIFLPPRVIDKSLHPHAFSVKLFIDREAGEIICLVASACLSACHFSTGGVGDIGTLKKKNKKMQLDVEVSPPATVPYTIIGVSGKWLAIA